MTSLAHADVGQVLTYTEYHSEGAHVIAGGVAGDILYYDGTSLVRLPIGSPNQHLIVTSGLPQWANAAPFTGITNIVAQSATAFTVARANPNYALQIDTSVASSVTGLKVTANIAGSGLGLQAISSATDEAMILDGKGAGGITLGSLGTGDIFLQRATHINNTVVVSGSTTINATTTINNALNVTNGVIDHSRTIAPLAHHQLISGAQSVANQYGLQNAVSGRYPWWSDANDRLHIPQGFDAVSANPNPSTITGDLTVTGTVTATTGFSGPGIGGPTGDIDMGNHIITNIGNANTDFDTSGGLTLAGNLSFFGTGQRIIGDFSNGFDAQRLMFQTSTVGGQTNIGVLPNGSNLTTRINLYTSGAAGNCSLLQIQAIPGDFSITSASMGTGVVEDLAFVVAGLSPFYRMILWHTGGISFMNTTDPGNGVMSLAGNFSLTGSARRILGDFSSSTAANRVLFQSSTGNGVTTLGAIPNGVGQTSQMFFYSSADPANSGFLSVTANQGGNLIQSSSFGTGTIQSLSFWVGSNILQRLFPSGGISLLDTTDPGAGFVRIGGGLNVTGAITLANNQFLRGTDSTSVISNIIGIDSSDVLQLGSTVSVRPVSGFSTRVGINISYASSGILNGTLNLGDAAPLHVRRAGSGSTYVVVEHNGAGGFLFNDTSQAANSRIWGFETNGGPLRFNTYSDAGGPGLLFTFDRTGFLTLNNGSITIPNSQFYRSIDTVSAIVNLLGLDNTNTIQLGLSNPIRTGNKLGIGAAPRTDYLGSDCIIDFNFASAMIRQAGLSLAIAQNAYINSAGQWKARANSTSCVYVQASQQHYWYADAAVGADTNITPTLRMTLAGSNSSLNWYYPTVAHGLTAYVPTNQWGLVFPINFTNGGLLLRGFSAGQIALQIDTFYCTDDTTKTFTSAAAMVFDNNRGSPPGNTSPTANANVWALRSNAGNLLLCDVEGDLHMNTTTVPNAYDDYNDAQIARALRASLAPINDPLRERFAGLITKYQPLIEQTGLVTYNPDGYHFMNIKRISMFTLDAIYQLSEQLAEAKARISVLEARLSSASA